jgi:hypothetical protein
MIAPMGRRGSVSRAWLVRTLGLLAAAALACGCVGRAQAFEDWNAAWTAEVSDRTGDVVSIEVLDAALPGADLAGDTVRVQSVDPRTVEIAWLGGACSDCAHFSLAAAAADRVGLRYDIGAPCDVPSAAGYALAIRFRRPIDPASITAIPDWGP